MKTAVRLRNHVLDVLQIWQREGAVFGGCSGHSNSAQLFAVKGSIQSPITSCSRRDPYSDARQAQIGIRNILSAGDAVYRP